MTIDKIYELVEALREAKSAMEAFYTKLQATVSEADGKADYEEVFAETDTAYIVLEDECRDFARSMKRQPKNCLLIAMFEAVKRSLTRFTILPLSIYP